MVRVLVGVKRVINYAVKVCMEFGSFNRKMLSKKIFTI